MRIRPLSEAELAQDSSSQAMALQVSDDNPQHLQVPRQGLYFT